MKYEVKVGSKFQSSKIPDETMVIEADGTWEAIFRAGQKCPRIAWTVKSVKEAGS
jgi:hypothetical protein